MIAASLFVKGPESSRRADAAVAGTIEGCPDEFQEQRFLGPEHPEQ